MREAASQPIKYISTGEKLDNLDAFYPDRMASRILGMGDVIALVERAQETIDEREAERVAKQMIAGDFTLDMFLQSQKMMKKMGSLGDIMKMMGVGGMLGLSSDQQSMLATHGEKMFDLYETAINSMTPGERNRPETINMSRRRRIARGSGLKENEVGQMLNEFEQMRKMFGQFRKMMGGMPIPGFPGMPGGMGGATPNWDEIMKNSPMMPPGGPPGGRTGKMPPGYRPGGGSIFRKKNKKRF